MQLLCWVFCFVFVVVFFCVCVCVFLFVCLFANTEIFLRGLSGKAHLGKDYWDPKRKLGLTTHFSEIFKLQFRKKKAVHCFVF